MKRKIYIDSLFLFKIFALIVAFGGLFSLALCQYLILAMYQLKPISAGLVMFIFVLFGLVCIFQAIRTKEGRCKNFYVTLTVIIIEILIGLYLAFLYISGMGVKGVKVGVITNGLIVNIVSLVAYALSIVMMFVASHKEKKEIEAVEGR